jgi:hypothetical protein
LSSPAGEAVGVVVVPTTELKRGCPNTPGVRDSTRDSVNKVQVFGQVTYAHNEFEFHTSM